MLGHLSTVGAALSPTTRDNALAAVKLAVELALEAPEPRTQDPVSGLEFVSITRASIV